MAQIIIKSAEQIEGIRQSSILAAQTLKYIAEYVVEGVSTATLDKKIDTYIRDHGALPAPLNYNGFPKSSCISLNEVVCHGIPNPKEILKNGDILNVDVTTILNGYFGDTSRMFAIGDIDENAKKLIKIAQDCLDIGIEQCFPENFVGNIGYEIAKYARANKCSVVYEYCGHGVGVAFHEPPEIAHIAEKDSGAKMKAGMTFTIEPMINLGKARTKLDKKDGWTVRTIDNMLSAQFEHTLVVTEKGCEVLTDLDDYYA